MAIEEFKNEVLNETAPEQPEIDYKAEYEKLMRDNEKLKRAQSNASADVSKLKKELEARMSEAELAEKKRADYIAELESKNALYEKERTVNEYTKRFMAIGYDAEAAERMASTLPAGIEDSFFEGQKAFLENTKSKMRAEALNAQPSITAGSPISSDKIEDSFTAEFRKSAFGK